MVISLEILNLNIIIIALFHVYNPMHIDSFKMFNVALNQILKTKIVKWAANVKMEQSLYLCI